MKKILYVACENADKNEGRGPIIQRGGSFNREVAQALSDSLSGVFGTPNDCELQKLPVYDTIEDLGLKVDEKKVKEISKALQALQKTNPKAFKKALKELDEE